MVHDARIVPLDGRLRGTIRQGRGDSHGRWDGNTLVVDTANFSCETSLAGFSANMNEQAAAAAVLRRNWTAARPPDTLFREQGCYGTRLSAGTVALTRCEREQQLQWPDAEPI